MVRDTRLRLSVTSGGFRIVFGQTDADVAFGLAYAHAEDDFGTIQQMFLAAKGQLGAVYGPDAAPGDYMRQLLRHPETTAATWANSPPDIQALCNAYAAGNQSLRGSA